MKKMESQKLDKEKKIDKNMIMGEDSERHE